MRESAAGYESADPTLLYRIARELLQERDYGELLAVVLDHTVEALSAERGFVLVREQGGTVRAAVARNFRSDDLGAAEQEVSTSIAEAALGGGHAILLGDAVQSDRFGENPSVRRLRLRSVLCGPLLASDEAFAAIYLENRSVANVFTERHRTLLDEICALAAPRLRAAVAIEQARRSARELQRLAGADGILTADSRMAAVLETVLRVASTDLAILIQGETGTGKELIARAVYRNSARSAGAFVVLNCAAIPGSLIEAELFGHVKGAFTGALRDRVGLIGAAHRGTLFLDEIGEMPLELQPRLLRVLQSGEFTRLGSTRAETADVRLVTATNRDLQSEVEAGRFRSDLYYRLAVLTISVPPLRDRPQDVHLLADHFVRNYANRYARQAPRLTGECLATLAAYSFPGNVRELESEIARLVAVSPPGTLLGSDALNPRITGAAKARVEATPALAPMSLAEMEKRLIVATLELTEGNRTRAAEILGISREGLRTKMQRFGLSVTGG